MVLSKSLLFPLLSTALALPTPEASSQDQTCDITPQNIIAMAPTTVSCVNSVAFPDECATARDAAPALNSAFKKYDISAPGTRAALIALMLFESGNFVYNQNHFPGRPGQGTRNMQMYKFNEEYATELFGAKAVATAQAEAKDAAQKAGKNETETANDQMRNVLKLVQGPEESFASAAWYLTKKCDAKYETGLATGDMDGWDAYLTECIETDHTPDRDTLWIEAKKALGVGATA